MVIEPIFQDALDGMRLYAASHSGSPREISVAHYEVLHSTAELEHELGLLPHNDRDVESACTIPHNETEKLLQKDSMGRRMVWVDHLTPNEIRHLNKPRPPDFNPDYSIIQKGKW